MKKTCPPLSSEMTWTSSYSSAGSESRLCFSIALWITAGVLSWLVNCKDNGLVWKVFSFMFPERVLLTLFFLYKTCWEKWPSGMRTGPRARTPGPRPGSTLHNQRMMGHLLSLSSSITLSSSMKIREGVPCLSPSHLLTSQGKKICEGIVKMYSIFSLGPKLSIPGTGDNPWDGNGHGSPH